MAGPLLDALTQCVTLPRSPPADTATSGRTVTGRERSKEVGVAFQAVPNTAVGTMKFKGVAGTSLEGTRWQWAFYVNDTAVGWPAVSLNRLGTYLKDWFETGKNGGAAARTLFSTGYVLDEVVAHDLGAANGLTTTTPATLLGTRAGDNLPSTVAMLVTYIADAGQMPPKWWQFPAVGTEADVSGNNYSQAIVDEVKDRVDDMVADLSVAVNGGLGTWALVGVSRSLGTEDVTVKRAVRRVTAETGGLDFVEARRLVASQRDRRPD